VDPNVSKVDTFVRIMTKEKKTEILNQHQSDQKIERMAFEILEQHPGKKKIILAGIANRGYKFAGTLEKKLSKLSDVKIKLVEICVNKKDPFISEPTIDCPEKEIIGHPVIVVDDVLNSGRTMLFALNPFLKMPIPRLSVAVLCNRSYRDYPVEANFVGLSLSTTLQEHIEVEFSKNGEISAYLI
jgi:pyrimidine operon attenuation protein/uracil phosphoribosyltransferase